MSAFGLHRLRLASLLLQRGQLGLACGLLLVATGCFGGPTSDLPNKADDNETPAGSDGEGANGNNGGDSDSESSNSTGGATGAGDAGTGGNSGASPPNDAGVENGADAAVLPPCTWSTPPLDAATCGGSHCTVPRALLSATPGSACEAASTLDAVCTGDAQRVVHACWRNNMLSLDRANAVSTCAKADPLLMGLAATCLDCYVALHECVSTACSLECALETSGDCEPCTNQKCVPAFTACSGLLTP